MTKDPIFVNDWGHLLKVTIEENGDIVDVSTATAKVIILKSPSGVSKTRTASFFTNGVDGIITYRTIDTTPAVVGPPAVAEIPADLDEVGEWEIQGKVTFSTGKFHTSRGKFTVYSHN
jgi:hypothetical protein